MCANYLPIKRSNITKFFDLEPTLEHYAEEAWPGSRCPIITAENGHSIPVWRLANFGLVPSWAETTAIHRHTYNARSETVATKPSFRHAWKTARFALVPMEAFFEPCYETGKSVRWRIHRRDASPFTVAAIWESWKTPNSDSVLISFSMLTINAANHEIMKRFHAPEDEKRSLVIVPSHARKDWLAATPNTAPEMLREMPAEQFISEPSPRPQKRTSAN